MTVSLDIQFDSSQWAEHLALTERQMHTAIRRALNKTARWVRTQVSRDVANDLAIRVGLVRERLTVVISHGHHHNAAVGLKAKGGVIAVAKTGNAKANAQGVRVGKRQLDHAFLATMPSGHLGVFRRRRKERLPILEVQLILTGKIQAAFDNLESDLAERRLAKVLDQELRFIRR